MSWKFLGQNYFQNFKAVLSCCGNCVWDLWLARSGGLLSHFLFSHSLCKEQQDANQYYWAALLSQTINWSMIRKITVTSHFFKIIHSIQSQLCASICMWNCIARPSLYFFPAGKEATKSNLCVFRSLITPEELVWNGNNLCFQSGSSLLKLD